MEQKILVSSLTHAHVTSQTYMMMLTYVSSGVYTEVLTVLAQSLYKLTDNYHWENFDLDALKAAPDDFVKELSFEIQEQAEKFEMLMHEITENSLSALTAEMWMLMCSTYVEFSHHPQTFLSAAVDVVIGNHELFPKEFLSFLVSKLMEYGMAGEINRLGNGTGFTAVLLPPELVTQVELAFQQMKYQQEQASMQPAKKSKKNKKDLPN